MGRKLPFDVGLPLAWPCFVSTNEFLYPINIWYICLDFTVYTLVTGSVSTLMYLFIIKFILASPFTYIKISLFIINNILLYFFQLKLRPRFLPHKKFLKVLCTWAIFDYATVWKLFYCYHKRETNYYKKIENEFNTWSLKFNCEVNTETFSHNIWMIFLTSFWCIIS